MNHFNTKRYIDRLADIVRCFNTKINRSIGMSPDEAYRKKNHEAVLENHENRYRKILNKRKKPTFQLHDRVRILKLSKGGVKQKGYKTGFSEEIFRITKVNTRLPLPRYHLCDMNNAPIIGTFQAHELSLGIN